MALRTERDVVEALAGEAVTLEELYAACEAAGVIDRDNGHDVVKGQNDTRWKRRVRNALQALKYTGRAQRIGESTWVVDGTRDNPQRALLVLCDEAGELELVLDDAASFLRACDEPYDLIVADPPWALQRQSANPSVHDHNERVYYRDSDRVVGGYVDVDPAEYHDFTARWMEAAAEMLRPGAYVAAISGPQQAARLQVAAEEVGLTYVNHIVVKRAFALRTTQRYSHAHWAITLMCKGPLRSKRRFFDVPADLPKARSGADYPLDVWTDVPKYERQGLLRYDNALPPTLVRRIVQSTTTGPDNGHAPNSALVADPFCGSGTTALVCLETQRRCRTADVNPEALRFTMARLSIEHLQPKELVA